MRSAALFSANEEADDIKTCDLPYLLLPYHIAQLQANINTPGDPSGRAAAVEW